MLGVFFIGDDVKTEFNGFSGEMINVDNHFLSFVVPTLSGSDAKVILHIYRNTVGRNVATCNIDTSNTKGVLGIGRNTFYASIKSLQSKRLVESNNNGEMRYRLGEWCQYRRQPSEFEWPSNLSSQCAVYLIYSTSGHYKIGISNKPEKRIRDIERQSTLTPFELTLIAFKFTSRHNARVNESSIHQIYKSRRVGKSEWFTLTGEDVDMVKTLIETG